MIRVQRGAAPGSTQATEERLVAIEAKLDTLIAMIGSAMESESDDDGDEIPSLYAERDQTQPL